MDTTRPVTRKSLPLTARDQTELARMYASPAHRQALETLVGANFGETLTDAKLLHGLLEAGLRAVRERVEEQGYAEVARQMDVEQQRAVARRRRPSWADEP